MRNRVIVRVIRALHELERCHHTWDSLALALGCTKRQTRRYVRALEEAHEPVLYGFSDDKHRRRTIRIH